MTSSPLGLNGASFSPMQSLLSSITAVGGGHGLLLCDLRRNHINDHTLHPHTTNFFDIPCPKIRKCTLRDPLAGLAACGISQHRHSKHTGHGHSTADASRLPNISVCLSPSAGDLRGCYVHVLGDVVPVEGVSAFFFAAERSAGSAASMQVSSLVQYPVLYI